jgi:7-cyano-7-deazaguanine reductase
MAPPTLETIATPTDAPIVVEHIAEEFTSQCPMTGHPDLGVITVRFQPRPKSAGGVCVELKSLKLYLQSFRSQGIFYEAVTDRIKADLVSAMTPVWLQVHSAWRGRGGIRSIIRAEHGQIPARYQV